MSKKTMFDIALQFILQWEGRFSTDRTDPGNWTGGRAGVGVFKGTKYGISAKSYPSLDIANLTVAEAGEIYRRNYWKPAGCDNMSPALALVVFDTAVNMGVGRAREYLGLTRDPAGIVGHRLEFYTHLDIWPQNAKGWARRCAALLQKAAELEEDELTAGRPVDIFDPATNKRTGTGTLVGHSKVYLKP